MLDVSKENGSKGIQESLNNNHFYTMQFICYQKKELKGKTKASCVYQVHGREQYFWDRLLMN